MVDGGHDSDRIRVAFQVDDTVGLTDQLTSARAELLAAPRITPWQSLNSRLAAPAGLQITLFQELEDDEDRKRREGFGTTSDC